jgi:hypothetical protein
LQCRTEEYRSKKKDVGDLLEEVECEEKLGQGFASMDRLEEMDIGDGNVPQLTYVNANLTKEQKDKVRLLAHEFVDCFAWSYNEMSGLGRDLVEHRLPIKDRFKPFKHPPRTFNPLLYDHIKEEVNGCWRLGLLDRVGTLSGYPI